MMDQKLLQILDLCNLCRKHQAAVFALSGLHLCLRHQIHHEISRYLLSCFTTKFLSWLIYNLLLDLVFLKDRFPITLILWVIKLMLKPICLQVPRSDQVQRHCLDCTWTKYSCHLLPMPIAWITTCWVHPTLLGCWHSPVAFCNPSMQRMFSRLLWKLVYKVSKWAISLKPLRHHEWAHDNPISVIRNPPLCKGFSLHSLCNAEQALLKHNCYVESPHVK